MTEQKAFCPGCPRRGVFMALGKLKFVATGDVICRVVDSRPPKPKSRPHPHGGRGAGPHGAPGGKSDEGPHSEVVIMDEVTLMDSGMSLLTRRSGDGSSTVSVILDNGIAPGGEGHKPVDTLGLCRDLGIARVKTVDPFSVGEIADALSEAAEAGEVSVIIAKAPCVLKHDVKRPAYVVDADMCEGCEHCLKVECSAMKVVTRSDGSEIVEIDATECVGCGICLQLCKHDAIAGPQAR